MVMKVTDIQYGRLY